MTFQKLLTLNGTSPRVAMELMRHSDMKLTMKTYTDAGLIPTAGAIRDLPSLVNGEGINTPHNTPALGAACLSVSRSDARDGNESRPEKLIDTGLGRDVSSPVAESHESANGARCRVRTCDPIRVKDVLYR